MDNLLEELDKLYVAGNPQATQANVAEKIFELIYNRKSEAGLTINVEGELKPKL